MQTPPPRFSGERESIYMDPEVNNISKIHSLRDRLMTPPDNVMHPIDQLRSKVYDIAANQANFQYIP